MHVDLANDPWNQVGIENAILTCILKRNLKNVRMVLRNELLKGGNGNDCNPVSSTPNEDNSLMQVWSISPRMINSYKKHFEIFTRKNKET